ncbi:MAG: DUF5683 domain-containing protein [Bacteroidota bacterium]|nr:DUF5683 domain-containing protein [Bacteroidota bacterium]
MASLLCLLAGPTARAQVFAPPATPTTVVPDTTERRDVVVTPAAKRQKAAADSARRTEHMFRAFGYEGIRLTRPGKAALLAALLPGAGQIYNGRWWKLPLVFGAVGGTVYGEYFYQKGYREFADAYNITAADPSKLRSPSLGRRAQFVNTTAGLNQGVIAYRGQRDVFYLYIGIAYGLQIVDALVDAHLQNFDVSDDLSLHWEPALLPTPGQPATLPTNPGVLFALRMK